jgi:hypothetical protein
MNRTEAINQLNLEKKRRENAVWQQWFATESSGEIPSERLQKRTADLRQIQNWYDDAVFKIHNTPIKEPVLPHTQTSPQEVRTVGVQASQKQNDTQPTPTQQPRRQDQQKKVTSPEKAIKDTILKGAENLPENKPITLGRLDKRNNIDGIQKNLNTTSILEQGRNTSDFIREREKELSQIQELARDFEDIHPEEYLDKALEEIKDVLRKHEIEFKEFLQELPGRDTYEKLQSIIQESRNVQYTFPVFILATAALVDVIEWINMLPGTGSGTLIILSIIKYTTLVPILIITTFGNAGLVSRLIMKKLIFYKVKKKGALYATSPIAEFIPFLGAFWPATFLFTLWLVNAKTTAGLILVELAKIAEGVEDVPERTNTLLE